MKGIINFLPCSLKIVHLFESMPNVRSKHGNKVAKIVAGDYVPLHIHSDHYSVGHHHACSHDPFLVHRNYHRKESIFF